MTDHTELAGRRVLVTGATHGIGRSIARAFAAAGATVVLHGRDADAGNRLALELSGSFVAADLEDPGAPARIVDAATEGGQLDVVVNNAGFEVEAAVDALVPEILTRLLRVNVQAPVEIIRLALPHLERSDGAAIVNVTSIHESVPVEANGGYAAAKAALAAFTRTAAIELGPRGVRINNLAPGAVRTSMNDHLIHQVGEERFARWIPLGRVGDVDDVAQAALFLAGPASRYVTGTTLTVDGGYSQHLVRYAPDPGTA
ncbi:short-chain dehydrogenase/reductase SDR [Beutenbergia cavernae DSM 12333]|uniref:Short-chain dehydrogenase/reductase SDR n=1 Tax=Beutenbergia cavernae (strain ATCC BAA-8 / DSM 12333 / CCUG 43141 / JCM 11478 / NBRC 16432 / NCIMB 13614 / HKI 0122) TaxID=471853 RepID=C5C3Q1_BEUC1|nr:SDR family oxidoreductase [Beutenbergia cavernae]ACQ81960.1 short-chain dehydrogenase/reductase SDR [Beutenbergia cavernae DSM 12333]